MYPDCLDIIVGSHVPYVKEKKIQKESFEEISITPSEDELINLGYYRYEEITIIFSIVNFNKFLPVRQ